MSPDAFVASLGAYVGRWAEVPLPTLLHHVPFAPDEPLVSDLVRNRASLGALRPEHAESLLRHLLRVAFAKHQFVQVGQDERAALVARVFDLSRALASEADDEASARAGLRVWADAMHGELVSFLLARLGPSPREVVCGAYSPELQLDVLGLDAARLDAPVLDVGCGRDASLVRWLRARGIEAHGVDRDAPDDVATVGDWLTFPYGVSRWGTVLSHLGFSLHFLHHHHAPGETAFAYARVYMALLGSLRVGGTFAYAPGLPFLEPMLPPTFRVTRVELAPERRTASIRSVEAATGLSLGHAVHVRRIG